MPFASASSPHFFQYAADSDSSPSIMVEPWEKKCTGVNSEIFVSIEHPSSEDQKSLTGFGHDELFRVEASNREYGL
jgi:hypothetical protein